ncbi:hypothetical protein K170097C1_65200 [Hungatella effluvii]
MFFILFDFYNFHIGMYSKIIVYCSAFSFYHNSESVEIGSFFGGFPTFRIYGTGCLLGVDLG